MNFKKKKIKIVNQIFRIYDFTTPISLLMTLTLPSIVLIDKKKQMNTDFI